MAENGGPEKGGKAGRPVTLTELYELLQQWQPLEDGDDADQPATAGNSAMCEVDVPQSSLSELFETQELVGPGAQRLHSRSHTRRTFRQRPRVSWDMSAAHDRSDAALVRKARRVLRLMALRMRKRLRKRRSSVAPLPQLPPPKTAPLSLTWTGASSPVSAEDARWRDEHGLWLREMRRRGRRLLALPEPEPFWLPHMLSEGADAAEAANDDDADGRRRQWRSAALSRPDAAEGYSADLEDSDTSSSDSIANTSNSTSPERGSSDNDEQASSQEHT